MAYTSLLERKELRETVSVLVSLFLLSIALGGSNGQGPVLMIGAATGTPSEVVAAEAEIGWGTAELIDNDEGLTFHPQVAVDPQGNAVAAWNQFVALRDNIWANRFVPGVGWGSPELIDTDDVGDATRAQVAFDPEGNAIAVWQQLEGGRTNIWANRFAPEVGWGTAEPIDIDGGHGGYGGDAQIAVGLQGNAIAIWSQRNGTRANIWVNHFVGEVAPPDQEISSLVIAAGIGVGVAATVAGVALLLFWRRRARGMEKT